MATRSGGSVRMGPISVFALIIILCLSVLAVLSLTTSIAELKVTDRQAATTTQTYLLERTGQDLVADVDAALSRGANLSEIFGAWSISSTVNGSGEEPTGDAGEESAVAYLSNNGTLAGGDVNVDADAPAWYEMDSDKIAEESIEREGVSCSGTYNGETLTESLSLPSGRTLAIVLRVDEPAKTCHIEQWKMITRWTENSEGGTNLWLGN